MSATIARALHQALGEEAADEMIDRINQLEAGRAEHRELIQLTFTGHENRIALQLGEFRQEMRDAMSALRLDMAESSAAVRRDMDAFSAALRKDMSEFKAEVRADVARLDVKVENRFAELMRWSLVYWLGAVGSIAALARILR